MVRNVKLLLIANVVLLVWNLFSATGNAQRPPMTNPEGIPFFNVNINPTEIPPMVNVNPHGIVPKVEVTQMPEIKIPPVGCDDRRNFQTGIGRSVSGPLVLTYLNAPQQTKAVLANGQNGGRSLDLAANTQLGTAIYLGSGQRLDFDADVLYSGCQPN